MSCTHVLLVGKNKGQICSTKALSGKKYCSRHSKQHVEKTTPVKVKQSAKPETPKITLKRSAPPRRREKEEPLPDDCEVIDLGTDFNIKKALDEVVKSPEKDENVEGETAASENVEGDSESEFVGQRRFTYGDVLKMGFYTVCSAAEQVSYTGYGIPIQGSTADIIQNPDISDALDEIALDFADYADEAVDPYTKLMFLVGTTVYSNYNKNLMSSFVPPIPQPSVLEPEEPTLINTIDEMLDNRNVVRACNNPT